MTKNLNIKLFVCHLSYMFPLTSTQIYCCFHSNKSHTVIQHAHLHPTNWDKVLVDLNWISIFITFLFQEYVIFYIILPGPWLSVYVSVGLYLIVWYIIFYNTPIIIPHNIWSYLQIPVSISIACSIRVGSYLGTGDGIRARAASFVGYTLTCRWWWWWLWWWW